MNDLIKDFIRVAVKSFSVEVEPNEQFKKVGASGLCYLHIADHELRLVAANDGHLLVAWPFKCLRRYMSSKGKFTIEAGRRAPTGEGLFTFFSGAHDDIYKLLDSVVKSKASKGQTASPIHDENKQQWTGARSGSSKTDSNVSVDHYDHLGNSNSPLAPHHPHPNYNHGLSVRKSPVGKEPRYASPYGHMLGKPTSTLGTRSPSSPPHSINEFSQGRDIDFDDGVYDTLSTSIEKRPNSGDMYNILGTSFPSSPPIAKKDQVCNALGGANPPLGGDKEPVHSENVYNTLSHHRNSQTKANVISVPAGKSLHDQAGNMYDSLNRTHSPHLSVNTYDKLSHSSPVVKSWGGFSEVHPSLEQQHSLQQADMYRSDPVVQNSHEREYNQLSYNTSSGSHLQSPQSSDTTYNTIGNTRVYTRPVPLTQTNSTGSTAHNDLNTSTSPQIPEQCPNKEQPDIVRGKPVSTTCLIQRSHSVAETKSSRGLASSMNEEETYSSLGYVPVSSPATKVPLLPAQKIIQKPAPSAAKPRLPPPRKVSAPDILAHAGSSEPQSPSKLASKGGNLISNLRASLEAGGLDLMKPKPKSKMLSTELSQEESIPECDSNYEAVEDQEVALSPKDEFSSSLYSEVYDDIYDEPGLPTATCRSKSISSGKPKTFHNK